MAAVWFLLRVLIQVLVGLLIFVLKDYSCGRQETRNTTSISYLLFYFPSAYINSTL